MGLDYQTITATLEPDRMDLNPVLERLNGDVATPFAYAQVTMVENNSGSTPSKAEVVIRQVSSPDEDPVSVTLQITGPLCPANLPAGTRVRITCDNAQIFIGELVQREEMGSAGALKLTFEDDRRLMWKMPVWGCLTNNCDNTDIIFVPRLPFRVNPNGLGNCVEVLVAGAPWPVPVFAHVAFASADINATVSNPTFWTPERLFKHLWYRLYTWSGGSGEDVYAHVPRMGTKFSWDPQVLAFTADEMKKKLPDIQMNGWQAAGIMDKLCEMAGSYGWTVVPGGSTNAIEFFRRTQVDYTNEPSEAPLEGAMLQLQRAGSATDSNTAFDFHATTDYRKTITQLTVEGQPAEIEALFEYSGTASDTLEYAHSAADLTAFKAIITGNGTKAVVNGKAVTGVLCKTREAYELAKHEYPQVGAFRIKTGTAIETILNGYDGELAEKFGFDVLDIARSIGAEQCTTIGESDVRYSVRVQVDDTNDGNNWHTVRVNPGLRVTDDGLIILAGLMSDDIGPADALYRFMMAYEPGDVFFKHVRINAVIRHDGRVMSTIGIRGSDTYSGRSADPNGIRTELDPTWLEQATGPAAYVLAAEREPDQLRPEQDGAFRIQHRMGSVYSDGVTATSDAYRDDQADLDGHADRRFKDLARAARAETWKVIGIRPDWRVGVFCTGVKETGGDRTGMIPINAAVTRVVYRFEGAQHTEVTMDGF